MMSKDTVLLESVGCTVVDLFAIFDDKTARRGFTGDKGIERAPLPETYTDTAASASYTRI
jgi:hypothetical protein